MRQSGVKACLLTVVLPDAVKNDPSKFTSLFLNFLVEFFALADAVVFFFPVVEGDFLGFVMGLFIYLGFFTSLSTLYRSYHDG